MRQSRVVRLGWVPLLAVLCMLAVSAAHAAGGAVTARALVSDFADRTLALVHAGDLAPTAHRGRFHGLVDEKFDMPAVAQFVAGRYWRTATDAERAKFTRLFTDYMVDIYATRFANYNNQTLKVIGERPIADTAVSVSSHIVEANGQPAAAIDWRVAKTEDGYRITDVIIAGVSLATTKRDEFGALFQKSGGKMEPVLAQLGAMTSRKN
jgi:phospholipid transport system substrate-binding protein